MTKRDVQIALGSLIVGAAASGTWFAPGGGQEATIIVTPPPVEAQQLSAAEVTKLTAAATRAGAQGDLTCARRNPKNRAPGIYCTDGKTAGWWLTPAQQSAFINAVRERFPAATADSVVFVSLSDGSQYDTIIVQE